MSFAMALLDGDMEPVGVQVNGPAITLTWERHRGTGTNRPRTMVFDEQELLEALFQARKEKALDAA